MHVKKPENNSLKPNASLKEFQAYIKTTTEERGWHNTTHLQKFLLFTEEVGELAKAIRYHQKLGLEEVLNKKDANQNTIAKSKKRELAHEFADVLSYLADLANGLQIDLETAFRQKDAINQKRVWK